MAKSYGTVYPTRVDEKAINPDCLWLAALRTKPGGAHSAIALRKQLCLRELQDDP